MTDAQSSLSDSQQITSYEDDIPVRGCTFSLETIRELYIELQKLTEREADHIMGGLVKPKDQTVAAFEKYKSDVRPKAFKLTVSIIGFDGQTRFGDTANLFTLNDLPHPIRIIFFTNENAFRLQANGNLPPNRFSFWIHFDKPPLFDPNPLVSDATPNPSRFHISARDLAYIRAAQRIAHDFINKNKRWYQFLHVKFAYDVGLWFVWVPYSLYSIVTFLNTFLNSWSPAAKFAVGVYSFAISLLAFRTLVGYVKWAFPVNVLSNNKDAATRHRVILAGIVSGVLLDFPTNWIGNVLGSLAGTFVR